MRLLRLATLFILLCAATTIAQDSKCTVKLADLPNAPELLGFRMGMTHEQLKARVPRVQFGKANEFGVSKASISPDFDPEMDKTSLAGVRTVSFDFLDDRLTSLWLGYDGTFKWHTVEEFVKGVSPALHLPDAWQPWKKVGQQLTCADFQMTVGIVSEGPSFHIIDQPAEETIATRRQELEDKASAEETSASAEVIGNRKDKTYQPAGCVMAVKPQDRVVFNSKEDAEKAGYKEGRCSKD
jgi:hypothetical protein